MIVKINSKKAAINIGGRFIDSDVPTDLPIKEVLKLVDKYEIAFEPSLVPYNRQHWQEKRFAMIADVDATSGWGNVSYNLLKYSPDYDIRWTGRLMDYQGEVMDRVQKEITRDMAMVYHEQPKEYWKKQMFGKNIAIVPFETTRVPASWVPRLNCMDAVFVPCHQNIGMMRNSGVKIPIEVIHWGVDPMKYYPIERPEREEFVFGHMGSLSRRKGTDILVEAFTKAFPRSITDVKLLCKTSSNVYTFGNHDPRIKVDMTAVPFEELFENFFRQIDCFVYPTRGEGFGLPPLEAMATGVPAITTNWSGPVDYNNNDIGWMLDYSMVRANAFSEPKYGVYKEDCGEWAEPNMEQLVDIMRYVYYNRDVVAEKGQKAGEYVRNNWTWETKIKMFHEALSKHLND